MRETLAEIREVVRVPAPCPDPLSLAHDGSSLWVGSGGTDRIYRFDPQERTISQEAAAPGAVYA